MMIFLSDIISVLIRILKIEHFSLFIYMLRFGGGNKHACKSRLLAYFGKYFFYIMHCMREHKNVFTLLSKLNLYIIRHIFPIDNRDPKGCHQSLYYLS